jgi:hypothetical protein
LAVDRAFDDGWTITIAAGVRKQTHQSYTDLNAWYQHFRWGKHETSLPDARRASQWAQQVPWEQTDNVRPIYQRKKSDLGRVLVLNVHGAQVLKVAFPLADGRFQLLGTVAIEVHPCAYKR